MKAAILTAYQKQQVQLTIQNQPMPTPQPNEVLVKVLACGVNPLDNMIGRGEVKLLQPYRLPMVAGNEIVGLVEQVGSAVDAFQVGDRVYGRMPLEKPGAFAEYAAIRADALAAVPAYLTDVQAAAVPLTALTAMEALSILQAKAGETLFISGGTGGFGQMAVPLAISKGIRVFTNGGGENEQRMLSMGVERFIDYKQVDYSAVLKDVDMVIDTLGGQETARAFTVLRKGGRLVSLRGIPNGRFAQRMGMGLLKRCLFSLAGGQLDRLAKKQGVTYDFLFVRPNGSALAEISNVLEQRNIVPAVDATFPLEEVNQALEKVASGHARGKTVLQLCAQECADPGMRMGRCSHGQKKGL